MKKFLFIPFVLLTFPLVSLFAQPLPCDEPAAMTSTCAEACVVCDINGFTGINNSNTPGQAPPGFCTSVVHHMQWIAFIAGTPNITLQVRVFNCRTNQGLEIGIYQSLNCRDFQLVSNCNTDVRGNTTGTFRNTVPLIVGQYYYFVMDGNQGDVCSYTITVTEGSTQVAPLTSSGIISGDLDVCPGVTYEYSTNGQPGATDYFWTLNGIPAGDAQTISLDWDTPGTYQLCVTASNACDEAPPSCRTVRVARIPPTEINTFICEGDCFSVADTQLCLAGNYEFHYTNLEGCDSTVKVSIGVHPRVFTSLEVNICEGDTLLVGGNPYTQTGQYREVLSNQRGCDSIVDLNLQMVICQMQGTVEANTVACFGGNTGSLVFKVDRGTPPFSYEWERLGTLGPNGQGNLANIQTTEKINDLPTGTYIITIHDRFGDQIILLEYVEEPAPVSASTQVSNFNGYQVSCGGGADGSIQALVSGGMPPYQFLWNDGSVTPTLQNLSAGQYSVTITDSFNCPFETHVILYDPPPIGLLAEAKNPDCAGPFTGEISLNDIDGGVPPYFFSVGENYQEDGQFLGLSGGPYVFTATDANGCEAFDTLNLVAPAYPVLSLGDDLTIDLGETVRFNPNYNVPLGSILWQPAEGLSCSDCPDPVTLPTQTTTYFLTVTSLDGCIATDTITVFVEIKRDIFVPNAFSPDNDGINDTFTIYAGAAVFRVKKMQVFSRWGELIFQREEFAPNDLSQGWDGVFRGKKMKPDVFVWTADVEFIDGFVVNLKGDVTLF